MKAEPLVGKLKISRLQYLSLLTALALQATGTAALALELELLPEAAKQGETVQVIIREQNGLAAAIDAAGGATQPVVQFRKRSFKTFPLGQAEIGSEQVKEGSGQAKDGEHVWRVLIGIPADLPAGNYKVKSGDLEKNLKVIDAGFGVQAIRLPKEKDNFNGSQGEVDAVDAAKAKLSPHQYWQGRFLPPSKARMSSPFGLRRRVNGVLLKDYFHSGLDFAGAAGSPVTAIQAGKVILAHKGWLLHGNTICIDHGQGVVSFYIHLSRIFVKEGDFVKTGQKIGAIGATGRASGPHLHFSIYVNQDATNPLNWFKKSY
jgi:murein DD-endopeptidase MepM/ murein hydrolase activator NlpD